MNYDCLDICKHYSISRVQNTVKKLRDERESASYQRCLSCNGFDLECSDYKSSNENMFRRKNENYR